MIIRREQLMAFAAEAERPFQDEIINHLRTLFPKTAEKIEDAGMRELVRHGIRRAHEYGIVRQCDVSRYLGIMFMFGPNFDVKKNSGPLYVVLRNQRFRGSREKTIALCSAAAKALKIRALRVGRKPAW